jgi:hypothetical protein
MVPGIRLLYCTSAVHFTACRVEWHFGCTYTLLRTSAVLPRFRTWGVSAVCRSRERTSVYLHPFTYFGGASPFAYLGCLHRLRGAETVLEVRLHPFTYFDGASSFAYLGCLHLLQCSGNAKCAPCVSTQFTGGSGTVTMVPRLRTALCPS